MPCDGKGRSSSYTDHPRKSSQASAEAARLGLIPSPSLALLAANSPRRTPSRSPAPSSPRMLAPVLGDAPVLVKAQAASVRWVRRQADP